MGASIQGKKTVLITGCSEGGSGFAIAQEFHARGLHVFATARSLSKMAALKDVPGFTLLALDVTDQESLDAAAAAVAAQTGGRLDVLVNNSGAIYTMPVLDGDIQKSRDMFEVNVWGLVATVKTFTPLIIKAKGTIVNVSSITALMYMPHIVAYCASKAAVDIISEGLRLELKPFGVKVVTVVMGGVDTKLFANAPEHHLPEGSLYAPAASQIAARATSTESTAKKTPPRDYARALVGDVLRGATGKVYRGQGASMVKFVASWLPTFLVDMAWSMNSGLENIKPQ